MTSASLKKKFTAFVLNAWAWVGEVVQGWFERNYCLHADTAVQIQYRQETIQAFEQQQTLLRSTVTTEAVIKGGQAIFLVAGSGSATAVTRGVGGRIPARNDNNVQNTCTLQEWHDLVRKTGFNIFESQGDQRAVMQRTTMAVVNRKVDDLIINGALNTGTVSIGSSGQVPNVSLMLNGQVKLQNASIPWDSNVTLLAQPALLAYLMQAPEWSSALYNGNKTLDGGDPNWRDKPQSYRWLNMLVVAHPNLPSKGLAAEKSFMYHKNAVGHAMDTAGLKVDVGYFSEQDYSWARATGYMGALVLQNAGIVVISSDGTAYA